VLRKERPRFERAGPFLSAPPFLKRIDWIVLTAWPKFESTECDEKAPAEADASHDPAELSRLVVGESPGFSQELGRGHRNAQIVSSRNASREQLRRVIGLVVRY